MAPQRPSSTHIPKKIFRLLNAQANRQWEESLVYASFAQWFIHNELPGSSKWCLDHSDAERCDSLKIFTHLADRRIEQEDPVESATTGDTSNEAAQSLTIEQPPQASKTFEWTTTPNVVLDIKGKISTKYDDPIHIWKTAMEREREMSTKYFEILTAAREMNDFVTEHFILTTFIPEQFKEEKAIEEILENALLVTKRGPELYFELDQKMHKKGH